MLRLVIVVVVLIVVGAWLTGYFGGPTWSGLAGTDRINTSEAVARARERGAELGEKAKAELGETAKIASNKAEETLTEAALTAKIKAKMALDDRVKARDINVTTQGTTVTVSGAVASETERSRAIALAKETAGITRVIDELHVAQ